MVQQIKFTRSAPYRRTATSLALAIAMLAPMGIASAAAAPNAKVYGAPTTATCMSAANCFAPTAGNRVDIRMKLGTKFTKTQQSLNTVCLTVKFSQANPLNPGEQFEVTNFAGAMNVSDTPQYQRSVCVDADATNNYLADFMKGKSSVSLFSNNIGDSVTVESAQVSYQ
ncbi:MAG TPA: hypothetical protein VF575_03840 [Candidatus Saccharimonadales bacterium]|jgi:hypothetical protein